MPEVLVPPEQDTWANQVREIYTKRFAELADSEDAVNRNLITYFDEDQFNKLVSIIPKFVHYGQCSWCSRGNALYNSYDLSDSSVDPMCMNCVKDNIVSNIANNCYHRYNRTTYYQLIPDEVFGETPENPLGTCEYCREHLVPYENSGPYSVSTQAYKYVDSELVEVTVHKRCQWKCNLCATMYTNNVDKNLLDGSSVCITCFNPDDTLSDWGVCDSCDTYISDRDSMYYSEVRGRDLCHDCYHCSIECSECGYEYYETDGHDCDNGSSSDYEFVNNYSFKPKPRFFGDSHIYMGIELEVEANQRRANLHEGSEMLVCSSKLKDRIYLKQDGSLGYGFEIVTHPHSLEEYHNLDWGFLTELQEMKYKSWNTGSCGLHVHIGLIAFVNEAHQIRFTKLIYDNQRQVERIAGRQSHYANFRDKGKVIPKLKNKQQDGNRYSAVNVQNEHTLEVRVFRGSLRKERVLSAIEFVHAVAEYTRSMSVAPKEKPFSWARFVAYVAVNSETYPNLFLIINETFERSHEIEDQEN